MTTPAVTTCANHPTVETRLRCNRCEKPICPKCAVRMPTGYRCKECVRGIQKVYDNAQWYDYLIGFTVAGVLSLVASLLVNVITWFVWGLIIIAAAPFAGGLIATGVQWTLRRRRARSLFLTCAAGVVAGALPMIIWNIINIVIAINYGVFSFYDLFGIFWQLFYVAVATPTVYSRLSGIQMSR